MIGELTSQLCRVFPQTTVPAFSSVRRAKVLAELKARGMLVRNRNASREKKNRRASNEGPLLVDEEEESETKPKKSREEYVATKKAKAAGVSHATAERAHAVVENRPDLALKVKDGEMTLNEAMRETKREEIKSRLDELAAREVVEPTGEFVVIVIDPPWLPFCLFSAIPVTERAGCKRSRNPHLPRPPARNKYHPSSLPDQAPRFSGFCRQLAQ